MVSLLTVVSPLMLCVVIVCQIQQEGQNDCPPISNKCDLPCLNTTHCNCPRGYEAKSGVCKDIDECAKNIADCERLCHNHAGNFSCSCGDGYQLAENGRSCSFDCPRCVKSNYQNGKYTCISGYIVDPQNTAYCIDVNECNTTTPLCNTTTQFCLNTAGSYECECARGFVNSAGSCLDINECSDRTHPHDCNLTTEVCVNKYGGFTCDCLQGLQRNNTSRCEDINECTDTAHPHNCDFNSEVCRNTYRNFTCDCRDGLKRNRSSVCEGTISVSTTTTTTAVTTTATAITTITTTATTTKTTTIAAAAAATAGNVTTISTTTKTC